MSRYRKRGHLVRYGILGPLSLTAAGQPVVISGQRERVLLAMLVVRAGSVVSRDDLVAAVWGANPPTSVRGQLHSLVFRLRRLLPADALLTEPAGYRLVVDADEVDAARFERLSSAAAEQAEPTLYRQALDMWRGPALLGMDSLMLRQAAAILDEQRATATEAWIGLELNAGRHREILAELSGLVDQFPLREGLRGQLMTALFRCGRQADALAEFRRASEMLREELGIDPGRELQDLQRDILAGAIPAGPRSADDCAAVRCLPRTVGDFTGRDDVVRRLLERITAAAPTSPVIAVIDGMAGSGKTTLALHVATLLAEEYPDAHLFVDLHGHSDRAPLDTSAALLLLLLQLGVPAEAVPIEPVARAALWRTEVARRRVLVILDNAASSAQLADLLPTAPGSLALVTTRWRLPGLDAVQLESLPMLSSQEAITLLERIVGRRVHAEPDAVAEVVRLCGGLPLAIRLAGARLAHRPRWRVADLLRRLGEAPLPELVAEDRAVTAAFGLSYRQLAARPRRTFRLLGVYPVASFDALAVAALTDLPLSEVQAALDQLVDAHLLEEPASGVFRLHDLLRAYAVALAVDLSADERRTALVGALDQQLHAAAATAKAIGPARIPRPPEAAPLRPDLLAALTDAEARLERERPHLSAFVEAAAESEPSYAWRIPQASWWHLWHHNYINDVVALHRRALAVAELLGDRSAAAAATDHLASAQFRLGMFEEAHTLLLRDIQLHQEADDRDALVLALGNLATVYNYTGRFKDALEVANAAVRISRVRYSHFNLVLNLATANVQLGRHTEALRLRRRQLLAALDLKSPLRVGHSLQDLAVTKYVAGVGTIEGSLRMLRAALRLYRQTHNSLGEAETRHECAKLLREQRRYPSAIAEHRLALAAAVRRHDPISETKFASAYAITLCRAGEMDAARDMAERALQSARRLGLPYHIACAQVSLAESIAAAEPSMARELWRQALETFTSIGAIEQVDVEKRLAEG